MALPATMQAAILLSIFILPILTYVYFTKNQQAKDTAGPLPPATEITGLFIHPIKSCHGISVRSAKLLPTGLDLGALLQSSFRRLGHTDKGRSPVDVGELPEL
jgi:hypothetical protein